MIWKKVFQVFNKISYFHDWKLHNKYVVGIGSGTGTGLVHTEALSSLQNVWSVVEEMIGAGRVGGAGLCDLRPSAFISLYNQATVKPTSIQVDRFR